jgi:hypothetical protein
VACFEMASGLIRPVPIIRTMKGQDTVHVGGFFSGLAAGAEPLMGWLSVQHSLACLTQPVERNAKPSAARSVFEGEEE